MRPRRRQMEILYLTIKDDNGKRVFLNGNYSERELKNRLLGRISQEDYEMGVKLFEEEVIEIKAEKEWGLMIWEPHGLMTSLFNGEKVTIFPDCRFKITQTPLTWIKRKLVQLLG